MTRFTPGAELELEMIEGADDSMYLRILKRWLERGETVAYADRLNA